MITLGTRGSPLALWQANTVAARIVERGGPPCRILIIKTTGDRLQDVSLSEHGGKGLFIKELEDALLVGTIDLAVHSGKDMSVVLPEGLTIAAALPREDPRDAVVLPAATPPAAGRTLADLVGLDRVGTSSVRRVAQLRQVWPAARFEPIRGNLETRLRKLDDGECSALVLASAGLRRLGFGHRIGLTLPADICVPAPGQGTIAVEVRATDLAVLRAAERANDEAAAATLMAERALVAAVGGGCQMPLGALATVVDAGMLELDAVVASRDGRRMVRAGSRGTVEEARALGASVAGQLLAKGAGEILAAERAR